MSLLGFYYLNSSIQEIVAIDTHIMSYKVNRSQIKSTKVKGCFYESVGVRRRDQVVCRPSRVQSMKKWI